MKEIFKKMDSKKKLNSVYLTLFLPFLLLSVSLRIAALLSDFNIKTGYFNNKRLITASSVILLIGIAIAFTYAFFAPKKRRLIATFYTPATYVPTGAVCTAMIFFAFKSAERLVFFNRLTEQEILSVFKPPLTSSAMATAVTLLLIPLALLSVVYFISNASIIVRASLSRAGFGIICVAFLALYACFLYFDTTLAINAPNKITDQMAYLFAALFFLYEVRISLGRECWNLYICFGFIASLLTAYSSIPSLVLYFSDKTTVSSSIYENILTFCLFVFIISRLWLSFNLKEDKESDTVMMISDAAGERAIRVKNNDLERARKEEEQIRRFEQIENAPVEDLPISSEEESPQEEIQLTDARSADIDPMQISYDEMLGYYPENELAISVEDTTAAQAVTINEDEGEDPLQEQIVFPAQE